MREIVIISGKGGTGKTSLTACFALLAQSAVVADCDVDAADLHLILKPNVREKHDFWSGHEAIINPELCSGCGACLNLCRFDAIKETVDVSGKATFRVDPTFCEGCGTCVRFCPKGAVEFKERLCGEWMISDTRAGPMVHARLGIAAENSGKLVSTVREEARKLARSAERNMILIDGPPGIGCPVIASLSGATEAVIVSEPTQPGVHDLERVLELVRHFKIPAFVCINKWDIYSELAEQIRQKTISSGAFLLGQIRYDPAVTQAQIDAKAVVETDAASAADIKAVWQRLMQHQAGKDQTK